MGSALPNPPDRHKRMTIEPAEAIYTREAHAALIRDLCQELLDAPSPGKTNLSMFLAALAGWMRI